MFRTFKSGVLYRHLWQTFHHPVSRTWRHISAATVVHCLILWLSHRWIKTKNLTSKMSYWNLCSLASLTSFGASRRGAVWEQQQTLLVGNICPSRSSVRTGPTGVMMGGAWLVELIWYHQRLLYDTHYLNATILPCVATLLLSIYLNNLPPDRCNTVTPEVTSLSTSQTPVAAPPPSTGKHDLHNFVHICVHISVWWVFSKSVYADLPHVHAGIFI